VHLSEQPYKLLDVKIWQRAGLDTGYESVPRTANESLCSAIPSIQPSGEVELDRKVRRALCIHFRA
jgi:hypothetical protein